MLEFNPLIRQEELLTVEESNITLFYSKVNSIIFRPNYSKKDISYVWRELFTRPQPPELIP